MRIGDPWQHELRQLFDDSFSVDWEAHLSALNQHLGLQDDPFVVSIEGLPPIWFQGDIDNIEPGRWTLVVSLNHQLDKKTYNLRPDEMWDFCRTHLREHWYAKFFRPLVMVASTALGESIDAVDQPKYATTRMLFVELCPYASRWFSLQPEQVAALSKTDAGFRTAGRVIDLLIEKAMPALVLLNGRATLDNFEVLYRGRLNPWEETRYQSVAKDSRTLWHKEGWLGHTPVIGFPFLRKPGTHNSTSEVVQLGTLAREFMITK